MSCKICQKENILTTCDKCMSEMQITMLNKVLNESDDQFKVIRMLKNMQEEIIQLRESLNRLNIKDLKFNKSKFHNPIDF